MSLPAEIVAALADMPTNTMFVAGGFLGVTIAVAALLKMKESTGETEFDSVEVPVFFECEDCGEDIDEETHAFNVGCCDSCDRKRHEESENPYSAGY